MPISAVQLYESDSALFRNLTHRVTYLRPAKPDSSYIKSNGALPSQLRETTTSKRPSAMLSPPLLSLPLEILRNILHRLDLQGQTRLAMTNRHLRFLIEPPSHEDFLQAEKEDWAVAKNLYTCRGCTCFCEHDQFADEMRKGRRALRGTEANTRLCIRCGVKQGLYSEGMEIAFKGKRAVLGRIRRTLTDHDARSTLCSSFTPYPVPVRIKKTRPGLDYGQFADEDDWPRSRYYHIESRRADVGDNYLLDV